MRLCARQPLEYLGFLIILSLLNGGVVCLWECLPFGIFMLSLALYHSSEYSFVAIFHPEKLSFNSFLLTDNPAYLAAMAICVLEFFLESYFQLIPHKSHILFSLLGTCGLLLGHFFRIGAEFTMKRNFTHLVAEEKEASHELVTHGVYSFSRHPGYFGWYVWSLSTQILLANPLCFLIFLFAVYQFFPSRIYNEELYLVDFFGQDYIDYLLATPTRIPFVNGTADKFKARKQN